MTDCTCQSRHDSSGFTSGLLIGLVFGAAAAHFLNNTERGQEILANLKENASEALKDVSENPALVEKIADLQKTMEEARATINSAAERVAEATEPPVEKPAEPKKNFFRSFGHTLGK